MLPASAFVLTLNPVRGPLDATASMSIIGHGAGQSVIDGNRQTGVLQVGQRRAGAAARFDH
jgi:hypothetical protein